jgi:NAD(P)H dehydrogenase (quinone)
VYAHPSTDGFTYQVLQSFIAGLDAAGHTYSVSDLYAKGFNPELGPAEYARESNYRADDPIPADVAAEQQLLAAADVWAFIYPVWWTDCPAKLKGWFDRVWTVGFAYAPQTVQPVRRALVICTAGHTAEHLRETGCYQAMETTMLVDRLHDRAQQKEFVLLGGSEALEGEEREAMRARHLDRVRCLAAEL